MQQLKLDPNAWRKPHRSTAEGNCFEINDSNPQVFVVTDTKLNNRKKNIVFSRGAADIFIASLHGMMGENLAA